MTPLSLRSPLARLAVAGVAAAAGLVTVAAPALADEPATGDVDDPASTDEAPAEEAAPDAPDPVDAAAPDESAPTEAVTPGAQRATTAAEETEDESAADDAEAEAVEPVYGLRKFRVGVRLADGVDLPADTSTAGSVLRISVRSEDGSTTDTVECTTTDVFDLEPDESQCEGNIFTVYGQPSAPPVARGIAIEPGAPAGERLNFYQAAPGATVTVEQLTAPDGLVVETRTATLEPCDATEDSGIGGLPVCDGTTDVWFEIGPPVPAGPADPTDPVDPDDAEDLSGDSARLPDTGGSDLALLALGAGMVATGSAVVVGGRRRGRA